MKRIFIVYCFAIIYGLYCCTNHNVTRDSKGNLFVSNNTFTDLHFINDSLYILTVSIDGVIREDTFEYVTGMNLPQATTFLENSFVFINGCGQHYRDVIVYEKNQEISSFHYENEIRRMERLADTLFLKIRQQPYMLIKQVDSVFIVPIRIEKNKGIATTDEDAVYYLGGGKLHIQKVNWEYVLPAKITFSSLFDQALGSIVNYVYQGKGVEDNKELEILGQQILQEEGRYDEKKQVYIPFEE